MNKTVARLLVAMASAAAMGGPARAADQTVTVTVNGIRDGNIVAGFVSTDPADQPHTCRPGATNHCTAKKVYGHPPRDVGNFLCIPRTLQFAISGSCMDLLQYGDSSCHANRAATFCSKAGLQTVAPSCNWRTNDQGQGKVVAWNWVLSQGPPMVVQCTNTNYQRPQW